MPGAEVDVCQTIDFPQTPPFRGRVTECDSDGNADGAGNFQDANGLISCRQLVPLISVYMESTTSYGSIIDSNVVSLPFPCAFGFH